MLIFIKTIFAKLFSRGAKYFDRLCCRARIFRLKIRGVSIAWTASLHRLTEISPMGGAIKVGRRTIIDRGAILRAYGGEIFIGDDCSINPYCVLYGHGGLRIGNGVRIATQCVFIPANHIFADRDKYICEQGETARGITIEDDVWIGCGARILDGVTIGKGAVIAAGAVVTRTVSPYEIHAGVPARKINIRGEK